MWRGKITKLTSNGSENISMMTKMIRFLDISMSQDCTYGGSLINAFNVSKCQDMQYWSVSESELKDHVNSNGDQ